MAEEDDEAELTDNAEPEGEHWLADAKGSRCAEACIRAVFSRHSNSVFYPFPPIFPQTSGRQESREHGQKYRGKRAKVEKNRGKWG